jgi:hypothetical protein
MQVQGDTTAYPLEQVKSLTVANVGEDMQQVESPILLMGMQNDTRGCKLFGSFLNY